MQTFGFGEGDIYHINLDPDPRYMYESGSSAFELHFPVEHGRLTALSRRLFYGLADDITVQVREKRDRGDGVLLTYPRDATPEELVTLEQAIREMAASSAQVIDTQKEDYIL